jgi:methionine-gamma-lyase
MTHAGVDLADRARLDVTDALVRISVGVENPDDIIADLENALKAI